MKNILIIGSGLAGTLVANNLSQDNFVTLLEIGENNSISYPKVAFRNKEFGEVKTFCYAGGGTSNLWHNGLMPLRADDLTDVHFKQIVLDSAKYIDQAAQDLFFPTSSYFNEYKKLLHEKESLGGKCGVFSDGLDCLIHPQKFTRLKLNPNVKAYYSVRNLNFFSNNGSITKVVFSDNSSTFSIEPDFIVISAGAFGSPGVVSNVLNALGLSNKYVGKGLIDHPMGFVGKVKIKNDFKNIFNQFSFSKHNGYDCLTATRIKCGSYTAAVFFRPAITMQNQLDIYKYKSRLGANSGSNRIRAAFSKKIFHPDVLAEIYMHLFKGNINKNIYNILLFFEQKRGECNFINTKHGILMNWDLSQNEIDIYNKTLEILYDRLKTVAEDIVLEMPLSKDWLWSGAHHSGTIPMGKERRGVIDSDLKIFSCNNAYVCDGSVIQEHSYTNTGLTIGALALRLSDRIRKL